MTNDEKVTVWVILHNGHRLGWKGHKGTWSLNPRLSTKYFGLGPECPPREECVIERRVCANWKEAEDWCASFPAHPAEGGAAPGNQFYVPEVAPPPPPQWQIRYLGQQLAVEITGMCDGLVQFSRSYPELARVVFGWTFGALSILPAIKAQTAFAPEAHKALWAKARESAETYESLRKDLLFEKDFSPKTSFAKVTIAPPFKPEIT